jgi:hypothetical protein
MLISSAIPNLINGVSQQPATLRLASQAEEQVNFLSTVADGLKRRPGTRHIAKLSSAPWADAFLHTIDRDATEKYLVTIRNGQLQVNDALTGAARTVTAPNGWGYLAGGTKDSYRAVTVADYTFIINRNTKTAMASNLSPTRVNMGMFVIKAGNYGKRYRLYINDALVATYTTPNGSVATDIQYVQTGHIAQALFDVLATPAGFYKAIYGDVIRVWRGDNTAFTLRIEDDTGGAATSSIVSKVQRFSDLPESAPDGFTVEIVGDNVSSFDNYYVQFASSGSSGVWNEVAKGGEQISLNASTMPHTLVREANGTFTFKVSAWESRAVGDSELIPPPSFIGRAISDIFFYRNRLGLLADENVILTQQGSYFNFWRDTATAMLDTDPLDIAVTSTKVSILHHALSFNQSLLLFSDNAQFILQGGDILSAETAYVTQATQFESNPNVRPVGAGQYVYFPVQRGSYTGIREYYVESGDSQNNALDVTSHCPHYVPKGIFQLSASTAEDILIGLSSLTPSTVWTYKFYFGEGGKLQSAWSRWDFSDEDNILSAEFIGSSLYFVISRSDGTYLEEMPIESGAVEDGSTVPYHMDRAITLAGVYDGENTTFTLPYATEKPLWAVVRKTEGTFLEGLSLNFTKTSSKTLTVRGNWAGASVIIGVRFTSTYTFSTLYLKGNEAGGGTVSYDDGRLQIRRISLNYADSGYFKVVSHPTGREPSVREFTGRVLASSSATLGGVELSTGRFAAPIMSRNKETTIKIETDNFLSAAFTSAEWEATYHTRAKRM